MTVTTEKVILNKDRNVSLMVMRQSIGGEFGFDKRPAVVILPGGAYAMCSDREAEVVAYPYLTAGFHAFVLRYSVAEHKAWPNPLNDWEQAMEYILAHAEKWGVSENRIAVIGFSAGGHLAACAATMAQHRPNAAILGYAALTKEVASMCQPGTYIPSPIDHVDGKTPPCFLMAARDDTIVPMQNPNLFMQALDAKGITYECHIYPYGGHGFSTAEPHLADNVCPRTPNWVRESIGFLEDIFGELTPRGFKKPRCLGKVNGDSEEFLSVNCTYGYLKKQANAQAVIGTIVAAVDAIISAAYPNSDKAQAVFGTFFFRDILSFVKKNEEECNAIDNALRALKNESV